MSRHILARQIFYTELVRKLAEGELNGDEFCDAFWGARREDLLADDEDEKIIGPEKILELKYKLLRKQITGEKFKQEIEVLWGYSLNHPFFRIFNEIERIAEDFESDPSVRQELNGIDETEMRTEARRLLNLLQALPK